MTPALEVEGLDISYRVRRRWSPVVRDVSFSIPAGGSFGLVGESGCGKSTVALAVVRYLAANGRIDRGTIRVAGTDVYGLDAGALRRLRSQQVSMVYQNPMTALNPSMRVGEQVAEVFRVAGADRRDAQDQARAALERVAIADPVRVMRRYPHQLSGGMAQRVVIAMALANDPSLLVLDEPTTGLDATVEAEVLDLVARLRAELGTAVLFISHNLGVIRRMCDGVGVLYAGRLVEEGDTASLFTTQRHPYTTGLLRAILRAGRVKADGPLDTIPGFLPDRPGDVVGCTFAERCALADERCRTEEPPVVEALDGHRARCFHTDEAPHLPRTVAATATAPAPPGPVLLEVRNLSESFTQDGHTVRVLRDVDLQIRSGETLGLVGESGSGKTTLARTIVGMHAPDAGSEVRLDGDLLLGTSAERSAEQLRAVQIVFQNPDAALNPSKTVRRIIERSVRRLRGGPAAARTRELAAAVQLASRYLDSRPSQLSGGLKQRVAIARAFAGSPKLVICDEPTSALDVSVQAAIVNLLHDLQRSTGVSYLFISHDLGVVRYLADRIVVLYLGEVMEVGPAAEVFAGPHHPYTEALLSAIASVDEPGRERIRLEGEIPSPSALPPGCPFQTRCPRRIDGLCEIEAPPDREISPGHVVRCHLPVDQLGGGETALVLRRR
jgi:peptide/nickel transport system ATP-binding protein